MQRLEVACAESSWELLYNRGPNAAGQADRKSSPDIDGRPVFGILGVEFLCKSRGSHDKN